MTIQWPKEKTNNLQNTTKKTKHWVTGTPQKPMVSQIWWKVKVLHVGLPIGKIVTILSQQDLEEYSWHVWCHVVVSEGLFYDNKRQAIAFARIQFWHRLAQFSRAEVKLKIFSKSVKQWNKFAKYLFKYSNMSYLYSFIRLYK